MEPNQTDIDLTLFNLIEEKSFEQLSKEEVNMVLNHMGETDFRQMRETYLFVQNNTKFKSRKQEIKEQLLQKFESKKQASSWLFRLKFNSVHLAASMFIASLLTLPLFWKFSKETYVSIPQMVHDTIVLTRTEPPKLITQYDTVFVQQRTRAKKTIAPVTKTSISIPQTDLAIQSLNQMNQLPNQTRNLSLKDDTLIHTYGFVSL